MNFYIRYAIHLCNHHPGKETEIQHLRQTSSRSVVNHYSNLYYQRSVNVFLNSLQMDLCSILSLISLNIMLPFVFISSSLFFTAI